MAAALRPLERCCGCRLALEASGTGGATTLRISARWCKARWRPASWPWPAPAPAWRRRASRWSGSNGHAEQPLSPGPRRIQHRLHHPPHCRAMARLRPAPWGLPAARRVSARPGPDRPTGSLARRWRHRTKQPPPPWRAAPSTPSGSTSATATWPCSARAARPAPCAGWHAGAQTWWRSTSTALPCGSASPAWCATGNATLLRAGARRPDGDWTERAGANLLTRHPGHRATGCSRRASPLDIASPGLPGRREAPARQSGDGLDRANRGRGASPAAASPTWPPPPMCSPCRPRPWPWPSSA